jgi:serine/threonine protein kinase
MDNTLLDDQDPPRIKLCDFGFAKWWTQEPHMTTITGEGLMTQSWLVTHDQVSSGVCPLSCIIMECGRRRVRVAKWWTQEPHMTTITGEDAVVYFFAVFNMAIVHGCMWCCVVW